jgi:hypothetical protein
MPREVIYKLPRERDKVAEIVKAIPSGWRISGCWRISGRLYAPRELYEKNQIAGNTRLTISRYGNASVAHELDLPYEDEIENKDIFFRMENEKNRVPRVDDVIFGRKSVSSFCFDLVEEEMISDIVKELAQGLIKMGYKGWISARNFIGNSLTEYREGLTLSHYFNTISLEWNELYDGKKENLDEILNVIKSLELELCEEKVTS